MVEHITQKEFEAEVLNEKKAVLVDFFATWCGPCQMLAPVIEKISEEDASLKVVKVDIDNDYDLAAKYKIEVVPTLVLFKNGKMVKKSEGFLDINELKEFVKIN